MEQNWKSAGDKQAYFISCYAFFNAGFFPPDKAVTTRAQGAYKLVCDQASGVTNAAWWEKDKLKGP
jgi:hypothetical protein